MYLMVRPFILFIIRVAEDVCQIQVPSSARMISWSFSAMETYPRLQRTLHVVLRVETDRHRLPEVR